MDGCENCDEFLRMKNNKDNIYDCTSTNFDGYISVLYVTCLQFCNSSKLFCICLQDGCLNESRRQLGGQMAKNQ